MKVPTAYIATLPIRHIKLVFLWVGGLGRVGLEFYFEFQQVTYRIGEAVAQDLQGKKKRFQILTYRVIYFIVIILINLNISQ